MAIGAKIKSAISKIGSAIKSAFSSGSQTASVMKFPVGKGLTPSQTATANKTLGISNTTTGGLTYNTNKSGIVQNTQFGKTPSVNIQRALNSGGLVYSPSGRITTPIKLDRTIAPTDVSKINSNIGGLNLSDGALAGGETSNTTMGIGSSGATAPAKAAVAGLETKIKAQTDLEKLQLADEQKKKEDTSWLKTMFEQKQAEPKISERRADLEKQYGIQEKVSEINSLTDSLNKVETEVANQVAQAQDRLGSNNFINNQIAQINRNSAPIINRLRADINFKTGILTQNRELIAQAISDATAESRQKWEDFKWFRNENQEIEKYISPEYKRALDLRDRELEWQHQEDVRLHDWKRDMAEKYAEAGVGINDSQSTIIEKIRAVGGSSSLKTTKMNPTQVKTYEAYKSQIDTYASKEEAQKELDKVKFGVIKSIGQKGYDLLNQDIINSNLPDKSLSWWDKLLGRK